ncbi:putative phage portal protein [Dinoroseobacter shibae DFL 12 = DSM 16493]|uniref:Phage portal protein n=2 Tax=root TaxID=1 RepID=A0AA48P818_9VIRU|nr:MULTISPECIES: phage portal protein [Dinoroseobacter]DBA12238.1 TPA_asm: phage portal protein [Dinogtaviriform tomaschi]ABV93913.1 putative phage portal protein [Dinoroseobacter shibae DFL 12 = DSM 16493]MDD9716572.1 phage portal protein [Dinoroseobacter sp. PD6]URF45361.1 phage portal protein [Dinoroseobacter shibae]URF49666.1 phage portal protein [Dinoroseobacter shibae]
MVFNLFRQKQDIPATDRVPEVKASATSRVVAMGSSGRIAWTPRDSGSLTRNGFAGNPVGFRAVKMIAEAAAALPLAFQDAERRYEAHPLITLLARPSQAQGRAEFFEALYAQLLLTGDGFVEAVFAKPELPTELHVLRSDRVRIIPGADGWPSAYEYSVGAHKHRFMVEEGRTPICHLRTFHPQDDHYGLSPMQAAATALDVHNAATRWSKALLDNAARPSGALVYKGSEGDDTLSPEQYTRLVDEMDSYHQGARNAGRPMLLEGGLDWKPMGFSPSDMEFQKTKEAAAREIALAFGVPPMLLGIPGDATYANYQEAHRAFYRLTVLPLAQKVTASLGHWLTDLSGDAVNVAPDLDKIPALAAERDAQWARIGTASFLTDAEKRVLLGLPAEMDCS